jgi:hypothetical protein
MTVRRRNPPSNSTVKAVQTLGPERAAAPNPSFSSAFSPWPPSDAVIAAGMIAIVVSVSMAIELLAAALVGLP